MIAAVKAGAPEEINKMISKVGSVIVIVTVFLFAIFLIINYSIGGYFV